MSVLARNIERVIVQILKLSRILHCTGRTTDAAVRPTTPTNLRVSAGTSVKFGCVTDTGSRIRWNFVYLPKELPVVLYNGYTIIDNVGWKISVNSISRGNEITIKNVTIGDSGAYSCHEVEKYSRKFIFHLEVEGTLLCPNVSFTLLTIY